MKFVLFDTCVPRPLRNFLTAHTVSRAQDRGWGALKNGELLAEAESGGFEVFVTSDKNLKYQQNVSGRKIAILVLPTNDWPTLRQRTQEVSELVDQIGPGAYREMC